jgi:60 kDa SS-A/Ro ribonucleoprotein
MKKVVKSVEKAIYKNPTATADTVNKHGTKAWTQSDSTRVDQIMMTGTFGNSFYASGDELVKDAIEVIERVAKKDPALLASTIVKGRNDGFIRTAPLIGLTVLSMHAPAEFRKIFNDTVKTGNDLEDFMKFASTMRKGFGTAIKKAMWGWLFEKVTPFYATKYTKQIANAISVSHPRTLDPIFDYIMQHTAGKSRNYAAALKKYPALRGMEEAKVAVQNKDWKKAQKLIDEHRLDPTTFLGMGTMTKDVWKSLSAQFGVMAYLKYLNKIVREDALDPKVMREKLKPEVLNKAKVFPFRLYIARENIQNATVRDHLAQVLDDYGKIYNWESWGDKQFVIAPDVSGSMVQAVRGSKLTPATVAGMFSGFLYKFIPGSILLPWSTEVRPNLVRPRQDSVLTHIESIARANGGGTAMASPIDHMIRNKIKCDYFIGITDSEEWSAPVTRYAWGGRRSDERQWIDAWTEYRNKVNKNAKAILLRVDGYPTQPFDDKTAKENGIYQIFGWSDNVLKYVDYVINSEKYVVKEKEKKVEKLDKYVTIER